jgi:GMP synthase (glutamine-hydrolysing)
VLGKAVGLQFHLESSRESLDHLLENCADELRDGPFMQKAEELAAGRDRFPEILGLMETFLDRIARAFG